ncbi:MAG TPA: hypothetical protein VF158_06665 [Longimicrobiales bacterium]
MHFSLRPVLTAALILAGCAGDDRGVAPGEPAGPATGAAEADARPTWPDAPGPAAPATTTARHAAGPFEGTAGPTERRAGVTGVVTQAAVRAARQSGYDRVVFEFTGGVPGYHIEYVDGPIRHCASGSVVDVEGVAHLRIRMSPARAHDDGGNPTIEKRALALRLPVMKALRLTCDFEAQLEWVVGLAARNGYRVLELREPDRLVVDVLH